MKKVYTFKVKKWVPWPKYRCPKCGGGWIAMWEQIDPDAYIDSDPVPDYHAPWHVECCTCGTRSHAFYKRRHAWKDWKNMCKQKE